MAYRRKFKKRGFGGSTGVIKMRFQSFMDVNTASTGMQIISINAGGKNILNRLPAQFAAYKYYKIGSVSVKMVPASTLPVDPTGLSITAGDNLVDPRDQLTPGMCRITNGEDILEDISNISVADQRDLYNTMLLDPRWPKFMLQSGFKRYASPRYWQIGQLHQDKYPGAILNYPQMNAGNTVQDTDTVLHSSYNGSTVTKVISGESSKYGIFQTGHKGVLGWLPTDGLQYTNGVSTSANPNVSPLLASPPEVEVMKIVLPPAYKTKYWYRLFITETVYFKSPIVLAAGVNRRPLDIFHYVSKPVPTMPQSAITPGVSDSSTGGNYGDN